jgi:tripartite-type tricarboxylate transporter receptor subunit TctC
MHVVVRCALTGLALLALLPRADAQDYPTRAVTIVVPFAPGGGTDVLARLLGQKLEERLGKTFIIENKGGAGTVIGANAVAKAAPDGYTLLMATSTPMAINVSLYKNLPYDPAVDLVPLAAVAQSPFVLVVNPALPVHSVQELVALAKARHGELSFASAGPGSPHHLFAELLKSMTGIEMTHVPYKGSLPALNDVVAGHVPLMFIDYGSADALMQTGKVRPLAVSTKARIPALPDVPPVAEAGVPGFDVAAWFMVAGTGRTPRPIVQKLHDELTAILALPAVRDRITQISMLPMDGRPVDELQAFVESEIARWGEVVKRAGVAGTE